MVLIESIADVKKYNSAVGNNLELVNIQSFIDDAINFQIVPAVSYELLTALVTARTIGFTPLQRRVYELLQKSIIGFALDNYADNGAVIISNSGIGVLKSTGSAPASDKKLIQLKKSNLKSAYAALELAVLVLEENNVLFPAYRDSNERKINLSLLINNSAEFQQAGIQIGNDAQLFNSLKPYIQNAAEIYILPMIGEELFDLLIESVKEKSLNDINKKLLKKIQKPLAAFALAEAIPYRAVSIDSKGIFELSETVGGISGNVENRNAAQEKRLSAVMTGLTVRAEQELEALRKYINQNAEVLEINKIADEVRNDGNSPNVYFL